QRLFTNREPHAPFPDLCHREKRSVLREIVCMASQIGRKHLSYSLKQRFLFDASHGCPPVNAQEPEKNEVARADPALRAWYGCCRCFAWRWHTSRASIKRITATCIMASLLVFQMLLVFRETTRAIEPPKRAFDDPSTVPSTK